MLTPFSALALIWLFMPQWPIALVPYFIYSIFHIAVYTRSDLIPTLRTDMVPTIKANLIRKFETNVVPALQTKLIRTIETDVVPALQTNLQTNLTPALQTALQTNLQTDLTPTLQTALQTIKLKATLIPVAPATAAPDAEMVPASDSTDKISVFVKRHYDMSMSVLSQTIISFFVPQWIYPLFHLVTRLAALPIGTSSAKPHVVSTPDSIADNIGVFIKTYYDISMSVVTSLEVFIWFSLLFSAITFQRRSWIMIMLYTVFLRARYDLSEFAQLEAKVDGFLDAQNIPLTARRAWKSAMKLTYRFYHASNLNKYMGGDSASKKTKQL
jgi:hypothetical protein